MMAPELERMAAAQDPSKVLFAKINCGADDDSKRLAMAQEIRALPTFKLFKAGQVRNEIAALLRSVPYTRHLYHCIVLWCPWEAASLADVQVTQLAR